MPIVCKYGVNDLNLKIKGFWNLWKEKRYLGGIKNKRLQINSSGFFVKLKYFIPGKRIWSRFKSPRLENQRHQRKGK